MSIRSRVILFEPIEHLRELVVFNLESNFNFDVIEAYDSKEVLSFLEIDKEIIICICSLNSEEDFIKDLLGLIEFQGRDIPLLLTGGSAPSNLSELQSYNFLKFFEKKNMILPMVKYINSVCKIDESFSKTEYTRVAMKTLIHFKGLSNDLFIRLGSHEKYRYIKYLSQGDRVTMEDVERKKEKGLEHLYIKKLAAKWILVVVDENMEQIAVSENGEFVLDMSEVNMEDEEADELLQSILEDEDFNSKEKERKSGKATFSNISAIVPDSDEEKVEEEEFEDVPIPSISKTTEKRDLEKVVNETEEENSKIEMPVMMENSTNSFQLDEKFVDQVNLMTKKSLDRVKRLPRLDKFLKKINLSRDEKNFFNNRLSLLINISCSLARALDWGTEATLEKLIFTSYIHDCVLVDSPHLAKIQTLEEYRKVKESLTDAERKLFLEHPKMTAKMLEQRGDVAPDICSMVLQHHELPDKSGFPEKLSGQRIIPMASLFIVSIDLATYICQDEKWDIDQFLESVKEKYKGQQFRRVLASLEKVAKSMINPNKQVA